MGDMAGLLLEVFKYYISKKECLLLGRIQVLHQQEGESPLTFVNITEVCYMRHLLE